MGPLLSTSRPDAEPPGYLVGAATPAQVDEMAWITWTVRALDVLAPAAFLAAPMTTSCLESILTDGPSGDLRVARLLPILEAARTGRRLSDLVRVRDRARAAGMRVAVTGHRLATADAFDAVVVDRRTAALDLRLGSCRLVIADRILSPGDVAWAETMGARLLAGPAVADPIRVAPIDVSRLQRRRSVPGGAPSLTTR